MAKLKDTTGPGDAVYYHQHRARLARVLLITRSDNPLANLQWLSDGARTYRVPLSDLRRLNDEMACPTSQEHGIVGDIPKPRGAFAGYRPSQPWWLSRMAREGSACC